MRLPKYLGCLVVGLAAFAGAAQAQQATRIVVPFAAGGGTDQYARLLAAELTRQGTQTIVENKPGASGIIAASYVAQARPDGTTVLLTSLSTLVTNAVMYEKLPYDPAKSFVPVTQVAYQPTIVVGRTDLPYKDIKGMVAYAKANPGKINRGSPGASILTNLAPVAFEGMAGISTTHIPFNGDTPGLQALLGGQIDIQGTSITGPLSHIRAGKMRVLGVMDAKRMPQMPDAPTFKEQGYDIEALLWYGLSAPAATPRGAVEELNRKVNRLLSDPEYGRYVQAEAERWVPILQRLNLPKQMH